MNYKMINFLNSIAPLTQSDADLGELLIISFVERAWAQDKQLHVNAVLQGVKNFSPASLNRKLRKLREKKILSFESSQTDERIRLIKKGLNYADYLDQIDFIEPNNHAQLR